MSVLLHFDDSQFVQSQNMLTSNVACWHHLLYVDIKCNCMLTSNVVCWHQMLYIDFKCCMPTSTVVCVTIQHWCQYNIWCYCWHQQLNVDTNYCMLTHWHTSTNLCTHARIHIYSITCTCMHTCMQTVYITNIVRYSFVKSSTKYLAPHWLKMSTSTSRNFGHMTVRWSWLFMIMLTSTWPTMLTVWCIIMQNLPNVYKIN